MFGNRFQSQRAPSRIAQDGISFLFILAFTPLRATRSSASNKNQGTTPLLLLALLLLFGLPLLFTLRKLFVFPGLQERSHQLLADQEPKYQIPPFYP